MIWTPWAVSELSKPAHCVTYLGRKVVGGTTQRPHGRLTLLRETEVCDLDVPIEVEQNVFGLQVTVDDILVVEVIQGEGDFGGVEFRDRVGEALWRYER